VVFPPDAPSLRFCENRYIYANIAAVGARFFRVLLAGVPFGNAWSLAPANVTLPSFQAVA
jgi:hypothetical protein